MNNKRSEKATDGPQKSRYFQVRLNLSDRRGPARHIEAIESWLCLFKQDPKAILALSYAALEARLLIENLAFHLCKNLHLLKNIEMPLNSHALNIKYRGLPNLIKKTIGLYTLKKLITFSHYLAPLEYKKNIANIDFSYLHQQWKLFSGALHVVYGDPNFLKQFFEDMHQGLITFLKNIKEVLHNAEIGVYSQSFSNDKVRSVWEKFSTGKLSDADLTDQLKTALIK